LVRIITTYDIESDKIVKQDQYGNWRGQMLEKKLRIAPIESLTLSKASYNHLKRAGFLSVFDVYQAVQGNKVNGIRNIGVKLSEEIATAIHTYIDLIKEENRSGSIKKVKLRNPMDIVLDGEVPITRLVEYIGKARCDRLAKAGILTIHDMQNLVIAYQKFERSDDEVLSLAIEILQAQVNEMAKQGKLSPFDDINGQKIYSIINTVPVSDEEHQEKFVLLNTIIAKYK